MYTRWHCWDWQSIGTFEHFISAYTQIREAFMKLVTLTPEGFFLGKYSIYEERVEGSTRFHAESNGVYHAVSSKLDDSITPTQDATFLD